LADKKAKYKTDLRLVELERLLTLKCISPTCNEVMLLLTFDFEGHNTQLKFICNNKHFYTWEACTSNINIQVLVSFLLAGDAYTKYSEIVSIIKMGIVPKTASYALMKEKLSPMIIEEYNRQKKLNFAHSFIILVSGKLYFSKMV